MTLPEIFFNPKQAGRWPITAAKKKTRIKRKGGKKNSKVEKPKAVGHFLVQSQNFDFCACLGQNVLNVILVARTAS